MYIYIKIIMKQNIKYDNMLWEQAWNILSDDGNATILQD